MSTHKSELSLSRSKSWETGFAYWSLLAAITISTLAFGSVELWSVSLMQLIVFVGFLVLISGSVSGHVTCFRVPGILPLLILLLYMALQALPLHPTLLKILSPSAFEAYSAAVFSDSPGQWVSLSLHRRGLLLEFLRFASYIGVYVLTVEVINSGKSLKRSSYAIAGFVSLLAVVSIIASFTSGNEILWLRDDPWGGSPFGPYINKNHYAGFMGMSLPLVIGLFLASRPRARGVNTRSRFISMIGSRRMNWHVLFGLGGVAIFVSVLLSLSRSGVAAMFVSLIVFAAIVKQRKKAGKGWVALVLLAVAVSLGWFGIAPLIERFEIILGADGIMMGARKIVFADSLRAAWDFILTGSGFGSFAYIYPAYRTLEGTLFVDHAHNDYIEFLVEGGIVSISLVVWFMVSISRHVVKELSKRRNSISVFVCYGSATGVLYMLLHSITDFNLHVGANGLFFFFILGLTVASSSSSFRRSKTTSLVLCPIRLQYAALALTLLLGGMSIWFNSRMILASGEYRRYTRNVIASDDSNLTESAREYIEKAVSLDNLNPLYRVKLAAEEVDAFEFDSAVGNLKTSLRYSPLCGLCLQSMASISDMAGDGNRAQQYLLSSLRYGARWTDKYLRYAMWLSYSGQRDDALQVFMQGLGVEPGRADDYIEAMVRSGYSVEEINAALPDRYDALLALAKVSVSRGSTEMAESLLDRAFPLTSRTRRAGAPDYNRMYSLNIMLKRYPEAFNVISEGSKRFADNPYLMAALGRELERRGDVIKALDTYRSALMLQPNNVAARRGVQRLSGSVSP